MPIICLNERTFMSIFDFLCEMNNETANNYITETIVHLINENVEHMKNAGYVDKCKKCLLRNVRSDHLDYTLMREIRYQLEELFDVRLCNFHYEPLRICTYKRTCKNNSLVCQSHDHYCAEVDRKLMDVIKLECVIGVIKGYLYTIKNAALQ